MINAPPEFSDKAIPLSSIVLGLGPMLPLPVAGLLAWTLPAPWPIVITWLAIWWAAALLIFIAGVRRGLTFRAPAGARAADLASMLWLFVLGAGALALPRPLLSLALLVVGYASVMVLDPAAARVGIAPVHFARLRPPQMAVALIGLFALIGHAAVKAAG
jgi:hypothetical protein